MKKAILILSLVVGVSTVLFAQQIHNITLGNNLNNVSAFGIKDSFQFQLFAGMQHAQLSNRPKQLGFQAFQSLPSQPINIGLVTEINSYGLEQNTLIYAPVIYQLQINEALKINTHLSPGISISRLNTANIIITDINDPSIQAINSSTSAFYFQFGATSFYKNLNTGFAYHAKQVNHKKGVLLAHVSYNYTINQLFQINFKTLIASTNQTNILQVSPGVCYNNQFYTGLYFDSNVPVGMYLGYAITPDWQLLYQHNRPTLAWLGGQNLISIRYRMN